MNKRKIGRDEKSPPTKKSQEEEEAEASPLRPNYGRKGQGKKQEEGNQFY